MDGPLFIINNPLIFLTADKILIYQSSYKEWMSNANILIMQICIITRLIEIRSKITVQKRQFISSNIDSQFSLLKVGI